MSRKGDIGVAALLFIWIFSVLASLGVSALMIWGIYEAIMWLKRN